MPRATIPMPTEATRFFPNRSEIVLMNAEETAKMSRGSVVSDPMVAALRPRSVRTERDSAPKDVIGARRTDAVKKMAIPMRRALDALCARFMDTIVRVDRPLDEKMPLHPTNACAHDQQVTV